MADLDARLMSSNSMPDLGGNKLCPSEVTFTRRTAPGGDDADVERRSGRR